MEPTTTASPQSCQGANTLNEHRLCWKYVEDSGFLDPVWPREPDMNVARKLAVECFPSDTFSDSTISTFAQGAFHRLCCIASHHTRQEYLMRVALPVDPFFKTESEVATMDYVRRHTRVPVPKVVDYASSASNELGFEWIFMERVDGEPLGVLWETMSFEAKMDLTVEIARCYQQLLKRTFPSFGNINFAQLWNQVGYRPNLMRPDTEQGLDRGDDGKFVIGRMVSTRFFRDKCLLLHPDCGPFATAQQLATAETKVVAERVRHLLPRVGTDYFCAVDADLADDGNEVIETADRLVEVIPQIYSGLDGPKDAKIMWHDDVLSLQNILIDPITHELAGVVDWKSVSIVLARENGNSIPYFLRGIEVQEPPPIGSVTPEQEERSTEIRKDWDLVLLRHRYTETIGLAHVSTDGIDATVELKLGSSRVVNIFEDR